MLYLLKRNTEQPVGYDEMEACVVRAPSRQAARRIADRNCHDEGRVWSNSRLVSCYRLKDNGKPGMIVADVHEG